LDAKGFPGCAANIAELPLQSVFLARGKEVPADPLGIVALELVELFPIDSVHFSSGLRPVFETSGLPENAFRDGLPAGETASRHCP
jgi:hypothetical protein